MAIGAFPLAKLGALLLKQISKPLANAVKNRAKTHPTFRTYVCMPPAQFYNWCEVQFKMWLLNLGKPVEVPKLNENQAIELGANILGEGIIFAIAAAILIAEYKRQLNKETAKEAKKVEEMDSIRNSINDIFFENQKLRAETQELMRHVYYLESELKKSPPPKPPQPIEQKPKPFDIEKGLNEHKEEKEISPTKINYSYRQANTLYGRKHLTSSENSHLDQPPMIKENSILAALNYLEEEAIMLGNRDNCIEKHDGYMMEVLDYLDSDVFGSNLDNNVIYVLRNAPYSSRLY